MRCAACRTKTLMEYPCRCARIFCVKCRLPEAHNCTADFKDRVELPKVEAPKVGKI